MKFDKPIPKENPRQLTKNEAEMLNRIIGTPENQKRVSPAFLDDVVARSGRYGIQEINGVNYLLKTERVDGMALTFKLQLPK